MTGRSPALVLATAFALAAAPASADGSADRNAGPRYGPNVHLSPTDEYRPPRAPRADTSLYNLFRSGRYDTSAYFAATPHGGRRSYSYMPTYTYGPSSTNDGRYDYTPVAPEVGLAPAHYYDRAPCPTISRYSLGALFACTSR